MSLRKASKNEYSTRGEVADVDELKIGCLLRIADATKKMAEPFAKLVEDRDWFKNRYEERGEEIDHLERRIRSLKGAITKLKK